MPPEAAERRVFAHQPEKRRRFRAGYLTDGSRVTWEYPRQSPEGDQMDIVEVMEIRDGLIAHHRVYWGWLSVGMLTSGEHRAGRPSEAGLRKNRGGREDHAVGETAHTSYDA